MTLNANDGEKDKKDPKPPRVTRIQDTLETVTLLTISRVNGELKWEISPDAEEIQMIGFLDIVRSQLKNDVIRGMEPV